MGENITQELIRSTWQKDEKVDPRFTDGDKLLVICALNGAITVDKEIDLEEGQLPLPSTGNQYVVPIVPSSVDFAKNLKLARSWVLGSNETENSLKQCWRP